MSLLSGNHDESVWDNPKQFQPERFISKEGSIINAEKILSFGYGNYNTAQTAICIAQDETRLAIFSETKQARAGT